VRIFAYLSKDRRRERSTRRYAALDLHRATYVASLINIHEPW